MPYKASAPKLHWCLSSVLFSSDWHLLMLCHSFIFSLTLFLFPVPSLPLPVIFCIFTRNWSQSSPTVSNQLPFWSTMPRYRDIHGNSYTHTDSDTVTHANKEKISTFWEMSFFLRQAFSILLALSTGADMCRYAYVQSCAHTDSQIAQQTEWH